MVVNPQGRVTIPAQIRREAGIEAGTPLVVYVEDGRVVIEVPSIDRLEVVHLTWEGE